MKNPHLRFDEFEKVNKAQWLEAAKRQLKGELPEDRLSWASDFGLPLQSYHDASDQIGKRYISQFYERIDHHNWKLYEHIKVGDAKAANLIALEALNSGCVGILFSIIDKAVDLDTLTKGILFEHCDVSFIVGREATIEVEEYRKNHSIQGFGINKDSGWQSNYFSKISGLQNLTEMVINFAEHTNEKPTILLHMGQDFFHELARIRALRYLFWRVADVQSILLEPNDIWIHCEPIGLDKMDEDLFAKSSAGLAAIIGGANSISFGAGNSNRRISRNVGNLIRDESKINTFQHAGAGSYFIDSLTDQMIQHVWTNIQNKLGV